jgi:hypothetical protein
VAGFYVSPFASIVNPDSLNLDPDPAFQVIRIQAFDEKLKKYSWKKCNLLISRPSKDAQAIIDLLASKENITRFRNEIFNFSLMLWPCGSFFPSWIRIQGPH